MMDNLYRVTAFPKTVNGGNKAGVYIGADNLSDAQMQAIAKDVGFSETAFVSKSDKADFKVRFFSPQREVDLCGHATIATFNLLRDLKIIGNGIFTQETKVGILKLDVRDDVVMMQQKLPMYGEIIDVNELVECFANLQFHDQLKPRIVSTGLKEIFLPVPSITVLNSLKPDIVKIIEISEKYDLTGIHAFALDNEVDVYGRNFAPSVGIDEESATGTSSGALGCYLFKYHIQKESYILRQGYSMGQPSEIRTILEIKNNEIKSVWVGGPAQIIKQ